ncbi:grasp-with-spasm system SPASM domain peptide maturase [Chryseobacterium sp. Marseille-Q8038]
MMDYTILKDKFLQLYSVCLMTKGVKRSVIVDTQREEWYHIPNSLHTILLNYNNQKLEKLFGDFKGEEEILMEYLDFLYENDLIFYAESADCFPPLGDYIESPSIIESAIIDFDSTSQNLQHLEEIFSDLELLGCKNCQFRFFHSPSKAEIIKIVTLLGNSRITSLDFIIKYDESYNVDFLIELTKQNLRIKSVFVHSTPFSRIEIINAEYFSYMGNVVFIMQEIKDETHCGKISPEYFTTNFRMFNESLKYNSCLYKKIGVDTNGNIKNCPTLASSFGNIKQDRLTEIVIKESFTDIWNINKNQLSVCKDCEYRNVCSDCRGFLDESQIHNAKPVLCGYDPYNNVWQE